MSGKKILVLVMSCTLPYYRQKEKSIKETWAKPILEGKYPNVDLWFFNSGTKDCHDIKTHRIFVKADDRRDRTFQKLCKTLMYVNNNEDVFGKYDYIIRVNISSVINIPLFEELISHIDNDEELWTSTTFNQPWVANHAPFFSGECFILSPKNIGILLDFYNHNRQTFDKLEADPANEPKKCCDDGWMTEIFYRHYGDRYEKLLKTYGIIYEPFTELYFENLYSTHPIICYKTDDCNNTLQVDLNPQNEDIDTVKRKQISEEVLNMSVPENWWEYFNKNILDKECRSSLFRVENSFCVKEDVLDKWHKFQDNGTPESKWSDKPDESKIWKKKN